MSHDIVVVLNVVLALVFLVSGIDDLFIDVFYWVRQLYRKIVVRGKIHPMTETD